MIIAVVKNHDLNIDSTFQFCLAARVSVYIYIQRVAILLLLNFVCLYTTYLALLLSDILLATLNHRSFQYLSDFLLGFVTCFVATQFL